MPLPPESRFQFLLYDERAPSPALDFGAANLADFLRAYRGSLP